jgi:hypothetical protein
MSLFLVSFISIYAAMHLLVWRGIRPLLPEHPLTVPLAIAWAGLMICAPAAIRILERNDWENTARAVAWCGYTWLGFLFLAFCGFVVTTAWDLVVSLLGRWLPLWSTFTVYGAKSAVLILGLTLALGSYALFEASQVRVEEVRIASPHLPPALNGLRIVQISDLHLGLIHRHATLDKNAAMIRALRPDLLVATGDIVDAQINHLSGLSDLLSQIPTPLGKYAVTGNHEVYAGLPAALDFIRSCGFQILRNQSETLRPGFTLVGVDDPAARNSVVETELLLPAQAAGFVLLLKHRPVIAPGSSGHFDLQLSGHAHRGQLAPFNLLTALEYPLQNGLHRIAERSFLYASRGTGTWGPPMRLLSPPEITLITLESTAPR